MNATAYTMLRIAADLWSGATVDDLAKNPEYMRGQVELIAELFDIDKEIIQDLLTAMILNP